jgi:hypothetical protein
MPPFKQFKCTYRDSFELIWARNMAEASNAFFDRMGHLPDSVLAVHQEKEVVND